MLGTFKARMVPINLNYRYAAEELAHVLGDAEVTALVLESSFLPVLTQIRHDLPHLRHVAVLDDGAANDLGEAVAYEAALAAADPERRFGARPGDDRYLLYTGSTTGAPTGVIWRSEDLFFAALQARNPGGTPTERPEAIPARLVPHPPPRPGTPPPPP